MTREDIEKKFSEAESESRAEEIAEKLTYEISYKHRKDIWRARYMFLYPDDWRKLGWEVYCLGVKDNNFRDKFLLCAALNYLFGLEKWKDNDRIIYNRDRKLMFQLSETEKGEVIDIFSDNVTDLIELSEYKYLLIERLCELVEKREKVKIYLEHLIEEEKTFYEETLEENKKEKIIQDALDFAKKEGLIK